MIVETQITVEKERNFKNFGGATILAKDNRQCVVYSRQVTGIPVQGWAKYNKTNSLEPSVGSIVKTNESSAGHLAVVVGVSDTSITIHESNYISGYATARTLARNDGRIQGYIAP